MKIENILFNDSTGKKSVTMTAFVWGAIVVNTKLLLSGVVIYGTTMSSFGGGDYAAALGALGAVYCLRRHSSLAAKGGEDGNKS